MSWVYGNVGYNHIPQGECAMGLKTIFAFTLALAPGTLSAAALDNFYGVAMASCVPTGQTSAQSVLFNSAAEASFRDGGTGEIILTCPICSATIRIVAGDDQDGYLGHRLLT
jgi:hypothetical protein